MRRRATARPPTSSPPHRSAGGWSNVRTANRGQSKKCRQAHRTSHIRGQSERQPQCTTARAVTSARPWPGLCDPARGSHPSTRGRGRPASRTRPRAHRRAGAVRSCAHRSPPPNAHGRPRRPVRPRRTTPWTNSSTSIDTNGEPASPTAARRCSNSPPYIGCHSLDERDRELYAFWREHEFALRGNADHDNSAAENTNAKIIPINSTSKRRVRTRLNALLN